MKTYNIVRLRMTTHSVPTQWEGRTDEGDDVYMRYRYGTFTVSIGEDINSDSVSYDALKNAIIFTAVPLLPDEGGMSTEDMLMILPRFITCTCEVKEIEYGDA
jgi:hypothetical protein